MRRRMKQIGALVLAGVLTFSALAIPKAYAAGPIETDKNDCSITVNVGDSRYAEGIGPFDELETLAVPVELYKVANVDVSGNFNGIAPFNNVNFTGISIDEEEKVIAAHWEALSKQVAEIVDKNTNLEPVSGTTSNGTANFTGLTTGLYLVYAQVTESTNYEYHFKPYLISLPGNNYNPQTEGSSDDWVYSVTVGLKPEKLDRYGDLIIKKTLDVYNSTNNNATFVFQVEATKTDDDAEKTEVVYSNVISTTFSKAGEKEIVIEKIPAGANVTVTEIYSGASYTVTSAKEQNTVILANDKYDTVKEENSGNADEESVSTVNFSNTHSNIPNGGSGVINNFVFDGSKWNWEKIDPSSIGTWVSEPAE